MIHQPSGRSTGSGDRYQDRICHIIATRKRLNEHLAANTGQPLSVIEVDTEAVIIT